MKGIVVSLALLGALAGPLAADFRADASNVTWFEQKPTAEINELRDALLWRFDSAAMDGVVGLIATAARPNLAITSVGGGNSEIAIAMPLTAGNNWVTALAARHCPAANTTALRRACADVEINREMRAVWGAYRAHLREQSTPVIEPPSLD